MKRTIVLKGNRDLLPLWGMVDPGTSPYWQSNTPSKQLFEVWNEPAPVAGQYAYVWPVEGVSGSHAIGFEKGPTLARFTKVTITTAWDRSAGGGSDPYFFPPDNAGGPSARIILRKRDEATWLDGTGAAAYQMVAGDGYYTNIYTEGPYVSLKTLTWEMTAHPEGGPWTLDDINSLGVGIQCGWNYAYAGDDAGYAYARFHRAFHKLRFPYLTVTLEIEDLGGFVDNVRHASSLTLRLMRRARNAIKPTTLADHSVARTGSRAYYSHPRGGSATQWWQFWRRRERRAGWGRRRLERRAGMVLQRTYHPAALVVADEALDLRSFACLAWAAYRIDCAWSPELQGLALLDKGKGFVHDRGQDSWSPRPGDGVLMRVLEDYPNLSFEGLAVAGGGDVSVALRNYDLTQSGWSTVGSVGDFDAEADDLVAMASEQGYLSSCRLTYGAGGATGGRERSLGALASGRLHLRVVVKNSSVPDPDTQGGEWYLRKGTDYWDEPGRAWVGSPVYNAIPSDEPFGEAVADAIPCAAATYHVGVGRFSSAMGPVTLNGALVDVQHSDTTVAGARPALVTLDAPLTRVADSHQMPNAWGRELWSHERGTAVVEVRPWWRAADLQASAVKPLLHAQHAAGTWDALQFVAVDGSDDLIRFERAIDGEATFQLECPIDGIDLTRAHVLRAWCRWLGPDGWNEWGPYSVAVGFMVTLEATGAVVATGSVLGRLASETAVPYARTYLGIGTDETRHADCWVRMVETRRNPLHELECLWRI